MISSKAFQHSIRSKRRGKLVSEVGRASRRFSQLELNKTDKRAETRTCDVHRIVHNAKVPNSAITVVGLHSKFKNPGQALALVSIGQSGRQAWARRKKWLAQHGESVEFDATLGSSTIDELYSRIAELNSAVAENPNDAVAPVQLRLYISRLRCLQQREAAEIERRFMQSLPFPLGSGAKALEDADALISRYENSASNNISTE